MKNLLIQKGFIIQLWRKRAIGAVKKFTFGFVAIRIAMAMDYLNYAKDILTLWKIKLLPYIFPTFSAFNDVCIQTGSLLNFAELLLLLEISICCGFLCLQL